MTDDQQTGLPPLEPERPLIEYAASERPLTRGDRIAFQVWTIAFLSVIGLTLVQYILMKIMQ